MKNVKRVRWSDVLTIINGKNQKQVLDANGCYPIYGSGGVMGYANDYLCEESTVIIGRKGNINSPIFVQEKFWNVDTAFGLSANRKLLDPKFLYYFCIQFDFERLNTTVTIPSLTKARLLDIKIPLPPLPEQRRIAEILDLADAARRKRRENLALYDDLIRSLFLKTFGDPVNNQKSWPAGTIRDLVVEAKYGTSKKADLSKGEYPVLRMGNITYEGNWDFSSLKYCDLEEKELDKYLVHKGDMLFNRTNSRELVGKTAVYREKKPMAYAGYLIRVRPNKMANIEYISAHLNSTWAKLYLSRKCKSIVGMANINAQELQDIPILKPPVELQNEFAIQVQEINTQKSREQALYDQHDDLFNALLQRAFKGEF